MRCRGPDRRAYAHSCRDAYTGADSNTHSDDRADSHARPAGNGAGRHSRRAAHGNPYSHAGHRRHRRGPHRSHTRRHPDADTCSDCNAHAYSNTDTHTNPQANRDAHASPNSNPEANRNADTPAYSHSQANADANTVCSTVERDSQTGQARRGENRDCLGDRVRGYLRYARPDGYVITNHHVVEGSGQVNVVVNDSATYRGLVIGSDDVRDLAVVSICCGYFQKMSFGNASGLESGHEVVNIGYPLGIQGEATVTKGIVSAIRYDSEHQSWVIQTDAAINFGNSGGPMLSMSGEVLGINTFKQVGTGIEGLGFAISEQTVQQRIPALRSGSLAPTPTPARRNPTPAPSATSGFGPMSGELRHDPADNLIETEYANVSFADMVVEATFVNPYSSATNSWDYGFIFRDTFPGPFIQIVVTSDRRWVVRVGDKAPREVVGRGTLRMFDANAGGRNHLRVVAIGERGWLFVNGEFVSTLDIGRVTKSGDVAVITGAHSGDEVSGAVTRFENFKGSQLTRRYGPAEGKLQKEPGSIATHYSGVQARDLVVEAMFVSPQGSEWDYGFVIRNSILNMEVIGVTDIESWVHYTYDIGDEGYTELANAYLWEAGAALLSRNHLLLIAIEEAGWFFVNGQLVSKLDLGHNLEHGRVAAAGDFFRGHQGSPSFEDFNVWAP